MPHLRQSLWLVRGTSVGTVGIVFELPFIVLLIVESEFDVFSLGLLEALFLTFLFAIILGDK